MSLSKKDCVIIFDNNEVEKHIPLSNLYEAPKRTQAIREALLQEFPNVCEAKTLCEAKTVSEMKCHLDCPFKVKWFRPEKVTYKDAILCAKLVHSDDYIQHLSYKMSISEYTGMNMTVSNDTDVFVSEGSRDAICTAIASVCQATDVVVRGYAKKIFCNVRPPGHHCLNNKAMGFCLLNNVAIAVEHAQKLFRLSYSSGNDNPDSTNNIVDRDGTNNTGENVVNTRKGEKRIAIIDWDFHHGNGTQELFYNRENVLYISLHGTYKEHYPNTGKPEETGKYNNILNINLETGTNHQQAIEIFQNQVIPKLHDFRCEMIYISCGFDSHHLDPVGHCRFTDETFHFMTRSLVEFADKYCEGRVVSILEGGYNVTALRKCSVAHIRGLAKIPYLKRLASHDQNPPFSFCSITD